MIQGNIRADMHKVWWARIGLASLAALLYYSWPLGYWLNPATSRHGLASDLAATGQPYNWLFSLLDVASGLLIIYVTFWLSRTWKQFDSFWIRCIVWGYGLFGVFTAVDALLPMNCLVDEKSCTSITHNPTVLMHGMASFISIFGFTLSIVGVWHILIITRKGASHLRLILHAIVLTWFGFGTLTVILLLSSRSNNTAQHAFITVCSTWTVLVPYFLGHLHKEEHQLANVMCVDINDTPDNK